MASIADYAIIGDCRSAALVSKSGSIDWLCWPRFDSPSLLGRLLDPGAGHWSMAPRAPFQVERHYEPDTNVLRTLFRTATGSLLVTDFMPVTSEARKERRLTPAHEILRVLECRTGEVDAEMELVPRPDYARGAVRLRDCGRLGWRIDHGHSRIGLQCSFPVNAVDDPPAIRGRVRLTPGESACASLTYTADLPAVLPPLEGRPFEVLNESITWWRGWLAKISYAGPWTDAVSRSALTLKLLGYAPSGAIVAAPTTSLPERIGGDLNWDYRFCWLRDASFTVRALFGLGFADEAHAFLSWLLHSTKLTRPRLKMFYDVFGKIPPREEELKHLAGYRGSRPVRIGNAAIDQRQLDVYGEVIDAATMFVQRGGKLDRETQQMLTSFGRYVCLNWRIPDEGIWEPRRTGRGQNTHSYVLCWAALDRLVQLGEKGHLPKAKLADFRDARDEIRMAVEGEAWNRDLEAYTGRLNGTDLDAAVLLLPWYGFNHAGTERMRKTYDRIRERLGAGGPLLYRYRRRESPGEGAFGICSFWAIEFLALGGGTLEEASDLFDQLLRYRNDVGLMAEEIDPDTGAALGNFPQAFTHVGLINAALSIERRRADKQPHKVEREVPPRAEPATAARSAKTHL